MESFLNPIGFATLLTALYVLRFRGWHRPVQVALYFVLFAAVELAATHWFLPPGAFGPGLGVLCLALTVPCLVAAFLLRRHEQAHGEAGEGD